MQLLEELKFPASTDTFPSTRYLSFLVERFTELYEKHRTRRASITVATSPALESSDDAVGDLSLTETFGRYL